MQHNNNIFSEFRKWNLRKLAKMHIDFIPRQYNI